MPIQIGAKGWSYGGNSYPRDAYVEGLPPDVEALAVQGGDAFYVPLRRVGSDSYIRWCIPGRDVAGTTFKDVSGAGNDGLIDANNSTPFAIDSRISTVVHASAGGVSLAVGAGDMNFVTDSAILAFAMTNEDPAGSEVVASWGAGTGNFPGFYFSHRSSVAGVGRVICNRGNGTLISATDSTVKFSNAGGTRETHVLIGLDGPTGSIYLYRDGVLAASNVGLMTGANSFTAVRPLLGPRLGGNGGSSSTVAGVFRGWQGYVFPSSGLPLNLGRIAAMLTEGPSVPLRDHEFRFPG